MKNSWRFFFYLVLLAGLGVIVMRIVRRFLQQDERPMPPPDRVVEGTRPAPAQPAPEAAAPETTVADSNIGEQAAPPPPPSDLILPTGPGLSFGPSQDTRDAEALWALLQNEAYRQRGEGYRKDWAFHLHAAKHGLGAPLAPSAGSTDRVSVDGKEYGLQPFARDTLFNEIPKWSSVQSLNDLLKGKMPSSGLGLALLEATYRFCGSELKTDWAFHRVALEQKLGPALGESHRITVEGAEYSLQVFAGDTLYNKVPNWTDVERLSAAPEGNLRAALWAETCKVSGASCQPDSPFFQLASSKKIGPPLSDVYQVDLEGTVFQVQVFARDTIYLREGGAPLLLSELLGPAAPVEAPTPETPTPEPTQGTAADALSNKQPVFTMLPVAGKPRISQFYGYTRYAASDGRKYYGACQGRHPGIDFAVPVGTPLLAVSHGVVMCAGTANKDCPFGGSPPKIVIVRYGNIYAIYGHASEVKVQKGQLVAPGEVVCLSGDYGGPHLHFEIRPVPDSMLGNTDNNQPAVNPGYAVNPLDYFSSEVQAYFEQALDKLGGNNHFCVGDLRDQERITFAGPVDNRPCT
jgi:murein DD-endopeptidase MepM/ murein hydrolase activator NlpD